MERDDVSSLVDDVAKSNGINADLYKNIIFNGENYGNKSVTSATNKKSGATGPAQVMAMNFRPGEDSSDPRTNLDAGARVLADAQRRYPDNQAAQVAYYNGGYRQGDAVAAGKIPPAKETQDYLKRTGMDNTATDDLPLNSVRTSSREYPAINPVDIMKEYGASSSRDLSNYIAAVGGMTGYTMKSANATEQQAKDTSGFITTTGNIAAAKNDSAVQIGRQFNVSGVIAKETAARQEAHTVMDQLKPRIDAEDQVSMIDDPLRALVNLFTLPKLKQAYNAAEMQSNESSKRIATVEAETQAAQQLTLIPLADEIRKQAALQAGAESNALTAKAEATRASGMGVLAQAAHAQLAADGTWAGLQMQTANMTADRITETDKQLNDIKSKQAKAEAAFAPTLQKINSQRSSIGLDPIDYSDYAALEKRKQSYLVESAISPEFASLGTGFSYIKAQNADSVVVNKAPQINRFLSLALDPKAPTYLKVAAEMAKNPAEGPLAAKHPDERTALLLDNIQASWKAEIDLDGKTSMNMISRDNPMRLKLMQLAVNPDFQSNSFIKNIMASTAARSDFKPTDDTMLLDLVGRSREMHKSGRVKEIPNLVKEFTDVYRVGAMSQFKSSGAAVLGMPKPQGYALSVHGNYTDSTGVVRALQTWNSSAVEQFVMQNLRNRDYNVYSLSTAEEITANANAAAGF